MEPSSTLSIATAEAGLWLVTVDMCMPQAERITISLRMPVQPQPSPTVRELEHQVLQRAIGILQASMHPH